MKKGKKKSVTEVVAKPEAKMTQTTKAYSVVDIDKLGEDVTKFVVIEQKEEWTPKSGNKTSELRDAARITHGDDITVFEDYKADVAVISGHGVSTELTWGQFYALKAALRLLDCLETNSLKERGGISRSEILEIKKIG